MQKGQQTQSLSQHEESKHPEHKHYGLNIHSDLQNECGSDDQQAAGEVDHTTPMVQQENEDEDDYDDEDDIQPDDFSPPKRVQSRDNGALQRHTAALGKRVQRSLEESDEEDLTSLDQSHLNDDAQMTPFAGEDAISNFLSEIKPFRNVIKRYWTEDEVIDIPILIADIQDKKLRTLVDQYGVRILKDRKL